MKFNAKGISNVVESSPALLHKIRLITPEDPDILQSVREEYLLVDEKSNIKERAYLTLITSIILQERLYFTLGRNSLLEIIKSDPNLGKYNIGFNPKEYPRLLAALYNQFGLFELIKPSGKNTTAAFRLKNPLIAEYLLSIGVDGAFQKEETLEFCSRKFRVVK